MAYDASTDQEEELNKNAGQQPQPGQQNVQLSGGGGGFAGQGGTGSQPNTNAPQGPTSSGAWTNLSSYLNANADNSSQLGNQLASNVTGQIGQTNTDLNNLNTAFQNQTPYSTLNNTSSSDIDQTFNNVGNYVTGDTTQAENYLNNNWGFTPAASDITQYGAQTQTSPGGTQGPNWGTITSDVNTAGQNLQATQSEAGRDQLLQNQFGQNGINYGQGLQNFDQLLLQQNPENQTALNSVYNQYAPQFISPQGGSSTAIPQFEQNAITGSQAYDAAEKAKAAGYQTQATADLNNQIGNLASSVQSNDAAKAGNYYNDYNQYLRGIEQGILTPDQESTLGINGNPNIYNLSREQLASNLTANNNPYTGTQAADYGASAQDWQNFQGLQALIDGMSNNATEQAALAKSGLTGTEAAAQALPVSPSYNFNVGNFNSQIQNAAAGYNQAVQNFSVANPVYQPGSFGVPQNLNYQQVQDILNGSQDQYFNKSNQANPGFLPAMKAQLQAELNKFNQQQGINNTFNSPSAIKRGGPQINR